MLRRRWTFVLVLVSALICTSPAWAQYTQRYRTVSNGAVTFAGNTLGLDGAANENGQGTRGSIGSFITTDTTQRDTAPPPAAAPLFPFGTTSDWRLNSSAALLRLPAGARILRAELLWGGAYAGVIDNQSAFLNDPVSFTTPAGTFDVAPETATARTSGTIAANGSCSDCYYVRSADVTALAVAGGPGYASPIFRLR